MREGGEISEREWWGGALCIKFGLSPIILKKKRKLARTGFNRMV